MKEINIKKIQAQAQRNLQKKNPRAEKFKKGELWSVVAEEEKLRQQEYEKRLKRTGTRAGDRLNELEDLINETKNIRTDGLSIKGRYG